MYFDSHRQVNFRNVLTWQSQAQVIYLGNGVAAVLPEDDHGSVVDDVVEAITRRDSVDIDDVLGVVVTSHGGV